MAAKEVKVDEQAVHVAESQEFIDALYEISPQERLAILAMRGQLMSKA